MNIDAWLPLGSTGLIYLQSKGLSRVFSSTAVQKTSILQGSAFFMVQLSHPYMTIGKTIALTMNYELQTFIGKMMPLLFNTLSRFVIAFLPKSKFLLISWLQSLPVVILEPKKIKPVTVSTFYPSFEFLLCANCRQEVKINKTMAKWNSVQRIWTQSSTTSSF